MKKSPAGKQAPAAESTETRRRWSAQDVMGRYLTHYNYNAARPHGALHYPTPADYLLGPAHAEARLGTRAAGYRDTTLSREITEY